MASDAIALTIFANNHLEGRTCPDFWPKAEVFRWMDKISFEARVGRFLAAEDPATWVEMLRAHGVIGFNIQSGAGNQAAGSFMGSSRAWAVEAIRSHEIECWTRTMSTKECGFVRTSLSRLTYHVGLIDLAGRSKSLREIVIRAISLLEREALEGELGDLEWFSKQLNAALLSLDSGDPKSFLAYSELGCDTNLSLEAKQVLAACGNASILGGMGSWNDVTPKPWAMQEYRQVTRDMARLLSDAACDAANSSFPTERTRSQT